MQRTTVSLPDDVAEALTREARRQNRSASAVVRDALTTHLGLGGGARPLPFAALGRSGAGHTARDMEELIGGEWHEPAGDR